MSDGFAGHFEVSRVLLNPHAIVADRFGGGEGRAGTGKGVNYDALAEGQYGSDKLPQEGLRFETGVGGECTLLFSCRRGGDHIAERFVFLGAKEASRAPFA